MKYSNTNIQKPKNKIGGFIKKRNCRESDCPKALSTSIGVEAAELMKTIGESQ
ncbi:MAG: hypothetical protein LBN09_03160 [Clostridioides sp.]|jgi:hypothetical protein|nr:hypothetical protein [Clostridioides sp.]